jgi:hypothetical protein
MIDLVIIASHLVATSDIIVLIAIIVVCTKAPPVASTMSDTSTSMDVLFANDMPYMGVHIVCPSCRKSDSACCDLCGCGEVASSRLTSLGAVVHIVAPTGCIPLELLLTKRTEVVATLAAEMRAAGRALAWGVAAAAKVGISLASFLTLRFGDNPLLGAHLRAATVG